MSTSNESLLKKRNIQELHMAELSDDKTHKKKKMKHISSTPFNDELNEIELELPESVLHYINSKFPSIHDAEEKARVERNTRKFWQTFVSNFVPTIHSYIDGAHSGFGLKIPSKQNKSGELTKFHSLPNIKSSNTPSHPCSYKLETENHPILESFLSSIDFIDFPGPHIYPATFDEENNKVLVEYLIQSISESLHIDKQINFDLLLPGASTTTEVIKMDEQTKANLDGTTTFQVILDTMKTDHSAREMIGKDLLQCRQEKFSISQWKFILSNKANLLYCSEDQAEVPHDPLVPTVLPSHTYEQAKHQRNKAVTTNTQAGYTCSIGNNVEHDIPSFSAITAGLHDTLPHQMTGCNNTSLSLPTGPTYNVNSTGNYTLLSNHKTPFLYSNSPLRPFNINSVQPENRFGTPLDDLGLYKLLEDFEVECKRKEIAEGKKKLFQKFSPAAVVYQNKSMQYQQVIFSSPVQSEFFKTMNAALPHLDSSVGGELSYKILSSSELKPQAVCSEPKVIPSASSGGGGTVALNHRHGPCSPLPTKEAPTLEDLLRRDKVRAAYVQRRLGAIQQSEEVNVPTELGTPLGTLEYIITVGIGSPAVQQHMVVDTGSDVSWVRCNSTAGLVLFDPSNSTTYTSFSCDSAACTQLGVEGNGCSNSQCQYKVQYADGSNTTGTYGSDTLALGSDTVKDFQFGCSRVEDGFGDWTDGLMGLGGDVQSLVSQTEETYGKAFSYCLPATASSSGFLTLGAQTSTSEFVTTGMLRSKQSATLYGVLLQGIRVGGKQLSVPSSAFSAGSLMDSGTIITRLPQMAYAALSTAFKEAMKQYPQAQPKSILDTCFEFSGQDNVTIPTVALVFDGGAVVDLGTNGTIIENCLAFAATDDRVGIIGNVQQRTLEVLYDVGQSVFGFRSNAC